MISALVSLILLLAMGSASLTAFAYNLPTIDSVSNLGPLSFYPDNREERLYKMPFDSGLSINVIRGAFNRPSYSGHKGYEFDFPMAEGHAVLAARAGYVTFIKDDIIQISHHDRDSTGTYTTQDWYIHVRTTNIPISIPMYVEQGQVITYVRPGLDHVHLEVQRANHSGIGDAGRNIESVPPPFIEVNRPDGIPFTGDLCLSKNKRFVPNAVEHVKLSEGGVIFTAWPNPFRSQVHFDFQGRSGTLDILSLNGRLATRLGVVGSDARWEPGGSASGFYVAVLKTGNGIYTRKIQLMGK